jgi:tripeptide aminopeptidase
VIEGGQARNIIPDRCSFRAEARSHDEEKLADLVREMAETMAFAATLEECEVETTVKRSYRAYRFRPADPVVSLAVTALARIGRAPTFALSGGGADANVFNERGLACVNVANGMTDIHTPDERIAVDDLDTMVEFTLALLDAAREQPA